MDITPLVWAAVGWFVLRGVIVAAIIIVGLIVSGALAAVTDRTWVGVLGAFLTWLAAGAWAVYAIVQTILSVIALIVAI